MLTSAALLDAEVEKVENGKSIALNEPSLFYSLISLVYCSAVLPPVDLQGVEPCDLDCKSKCRPVGKPVADGFL